MADRQRDRQTGRQAGLSVQHHASKPVADRVREAAANARHQTKQAAPAAEQEQKTDQQAAGCLDAQDVLTMRIHWRDIRNRAAAAERFIVKTALRLDQQTSHPTDDRFTREQLRGFVRNVRVLLNVLDARIGAADE